MKPLQVLYSEREAAVTTLDAAKAALGAIDAEILAATKARVEQLYALTGKTHGTVTADVGDFKIKGDISKTVSYDTAKLLPIASKMSYEEATKTFKIEFSVAEKVYKGLTPELRAEIDKARTTKYAPLKITLVKK